MNDVFDPRKDGLKLLELRPGPEVVELRKNAALVVISESPIQQLSPEGARYTSFR
jgi:hypothetical protein